MSLSAQRYKSGSYWNYTIGNLFCIALQEEEYVSLLSIKNEHEIRPNSYIIYMHDFPKEILAKYSKMVLEFGRLDKNKLQEKINELDKQLHQANIELNNINELELLCQK